MPNYNIAHKNDGKNYVLRDNGGNIKVLSSTPPVVTNGLVVHLDSTTQSPGYAVGNTWYDSSGNNNNAKLYNGVTYDGNFFVFDGVDEYAEITNNSGINNCLNSDFTFDIWAYCQSQSWVYPKIFSKGRYSSDGAINGVMRNNTYSPNDVLWQHQNKSGVLVSLHRKSIPFNSWQNLTYTRVSGVFKFYLNGVLQSTVSNSDDLRSNFNIKIGANSNWGTNAENARQKIMSFRQYNRGLSASEVLQNYNASVGKTTPASFVALTDPYDDRSFVAFNTSEIDKIDFNYVLETDTTTLRKSEDGSLTFVKWTGSTPSFVGDLTTKQSIVSYTQISSDVNNSTWNGQTTENESPPYPYSYFYLMGDQEDLTMEW
jgi:hypothetical protein